MTNQKKKYFDASSIYSKIAKYLPNTLWRNKPIDVSIFAQEFEKQKNEENEVEK